MDLRKSPTLITYSLDLTHAQRRALLDILILAGAAVGSAPLNMAADTIRGLVYAASGSFPGDAPEFAAWRADFDRAALRAAQDAASLWEARYWFSHSYDPHGAVAERRKMWGI